MKPGDTIKRIGDPYSWAPLGFITKCCTDPTETTPVDITQRYGALGYTCLDGSFVFIYGMENWEVIDGEPPLYGKGVDYSAPDIVVRNEMKQATYTPGQFDQAQKLYDIVTKWRDDNNVWDGEVIALYDDVRETFDELIHSLINVVGYAPYKED